MSGTIILLPVYAFMVSRQTLPLQWWYTIASCYNVCTHSYMNTTKIITIKVLQEFLVHYFTMPSIAKITYCWWWMNVYGNFGGMILTGQTKVLGAKTCPSAIWSATDPTGTGLGLNTGLYRKRPVTNCLSYSTANVSECLSLLGITVIS